MVVPLSNIKVSPHGSCKFPCKLYGSISFIKLPAVVLSDKEKEVWLNLKCLTVLVRLKYVKF